MFWLFACTVSSIERCYPCFSGTGAKEPSHPILISMSGLLPIGAKVSPSTARNRHPIFEVLKPRLPPRGLVLEIAAGFGEHAVYNAAAVPYLDWQPTDQDPESLDSIAAWHDHAALPNLLPPLQL